jgi:imidazolonepropionase-like amidohydrolase
LKIIVKAPRMFDSVTGNVCTDVNVVIENGKIISLGSSSIDYTTNEIKVIDLSGCKNAFVLPGLIDSHLHLAHGGVDEREKDDKDPLVSLRMYHNGIRNLLAGVTTQRDCGAKHHIDVCYREGVRLGLINGPKTLISGQPIIPTGGHCTYMGRQIDGKDEATKAVREQLQQQVDLIKLMVTGGVSTPTGHPTTPQMTREEIEACVLIAHNNGKMVAAHAEGGIGVDWALEAGIDTLEHGIYLTDAQIEKILDKNVWYVPTLYAINAIANEGASLPVPMSKMMIDKCAVAFERHAESFTKAYRAGVKMAVGTDYRHGEIVNELLLMTRYGMKNSEAIQCATRYASQMLRLDEEIGSIEVGKNADILVVSGNPLENIEELRNVHLVIQNGNVVVKDGLLLPATSYKHK